MKSLTILSFGGGQDSTCILYRLILDPGFRQRYVKGDLIVVMSNTGNEHPYTYRHVHFVKALCKKHEIPFFVLNGKAGYHSRTWHSLEHQFKRNKSIMSIMFPRSCTDNLKIRPIYNFVDHYIATKYYGYSKRDLPKGKKFIKQFTADGGTITVILGISLGEEKRINKVENRKSLSWQLDLFKKIKKPNNHWMERCIDKSYPLICEGMDRKACQSYIRETGLPLPFPSNCMMCPYISKPELLWLYRKLPKQFYKWVGYERAKIQNNTHAKVNHGVKGEKLLETILEEAISQFGHLTDQQLDEYKMSHGHCVQSKF